MGDYQRHAQGAAGMAGRGATLESVLGVRGSSFHCRVFRFTCGGVRYGDVVRSRCGSIEVDVVPLLPHLARGFGMLLGLAGCVFVALRVQCEKARLGL